MQFLTCVCVRAFACVSSHGVNSNAKRAKYLNTQTHFGFRNVHDVLYIMSNRSSNTSPQQTKSIDFNGVSFVMKECTVFDIHVFGFYTHSS